MNFKQDHTGLCFENRFEDREETRRQVVELCGSVHEKVGTCTRVVAGAEVRNESLTSFMGKLI